MPPWWCGVSDILNHFIETCRVHNPAAAAGGYPPFTAPFRRETPLNSAPYIFPFADFRTTFGTNARRRRIIADAEAALDALRRHGLMWHLLIVGGSFIRDEDRPSDLDALVVYALDPAMAADAAPVIAGIPPILRCHPHVDFKFCPIDISPLILVKRLLFFANLFSYDKDTHAMSRGSIVVLPETLPETLNASGIEDACA